MTTSDSGTWNPESFDRGLTECGTCGTRAAGGTGIDPSSLWRLVHDEIRRYLAGASPDATVARSPLAEGDGSGGEGCEAQERSERLNLGAQLSLSDGGNLAVNRRVVRALIAEVGHLRYEVDRRARSIIAANGRTERVEAALVRIRGERDSAVISADQWKADAIQAERECDYLRKFLDETVRERDEARTALAVARAQAESEAVARAEAEAERDETRAELPGKIAAAIEERAERFATPSPSAFDGVGLGREQGFRGGFRESAKVARSFAAPVEPVPEPVREWGVRHIDDSGRWNIREGYSQIGARDRVALSDCAARACHVVSRVPGGEWEAAE